MGKRIFIGFALLCVLVPILSEILPILGGLILVGGFTAMIAYLVKMWKEEKASDKRAEQYGWDPQRWSRDNQNTQNTQGRSTSQRNPNPYSQTGTSYSRTGYSQTGYRSGSSAGRTSSYTQQTASQTTLPRTVKKRRKIVESFNEKYDLDLTDDQMNSIVNSSYMSEIWRNELEAMDRKYETVYEWFQGPMGWLRSYMYVFHIQEITSDIRQQEEICMYTFETVFQYVDSLGGIPQNKKIEMVNNKYFTSFDDVSFMIAYRFLEAKGLNHDLKGPDLAKNADSADDLVNKYASWEEEKLGL